MSKPRYIQLIRKYLTPLYVGQTVLRHLVAFPQSYLNTTGWLESIRRDHPCRPDGSPLPWMNYPTIDLLEQKLRNTMRVFEYGSGYSTLFFASRVQTVVAVEGNQDWRDKISRRLPHNARIVYCREDVDGAYCRSILKESKAFNLIVVDGRDRVNCLRHSVKRLADDGVVLLDDAQRPEYNEGITWMKNEGFKHLSLSGLQPNGFEVDRACFFYREPNCFGL